MSGRDVKYWPGPALHVGGVALQEALVDVALNVGIYLKPRFAVHQGDQALELGGVLYLVLRLAKDGPEHPRLPPELFEDVAVLDL